MGEVQFDWISCEDCEGEGGWQQTTHKPWCNSRDMGECNCDPVTDWIICPTCEGEEGVLVPR